MKKTLTIISAVVMILTSVSLYIFVRQPFHDVPREYSALVNALKTEVNAAYAVKDINGDKVKELFLFRGNRYRLFTIDRETLTEVQVKDCPLPDENGLFYSGGEFNGGFQDFFIYHPSNRICRTLDSRRIPQHAHPVGRLPKRPRRPALF
jgi:hypothetical protein